MNLRVSLPYGCSALVITSEDDRPPYVPPPAPPIEPTRHPSYCLCPPCRADRRTRDVAR